MNNSSESENLNGKENGVGSNDAAAKQPRRIRGCLLGGVSLLLLAFSAAYAYQQWFGIQVDPDLKDVEITVNDSNGTDDSEDPVEEGITSGLTEKAIQDAEHPLMPALEVARLGLASMEKNVHDYQAVIVKQARVKDKLSDVEHMKVKIRHRRTLDDGTEIPFSVYTRFMSPQNVVGQEAIFVEGWNDGNLIAHLKPGIFNRLNIPLDPNGPIAMKGNIYPITMLGLKNLIKEMIAKGTRDLEHGECEVTFDRNIEIDGRKCLLLEITHPVERKHFEFHKAKIYIDLDYQVPVAYEGFLWPKEEGGEAVLLERYIYTELKINIGLDDSDFDTANEEYDYPG